MNEKDTSLLDDYFNDLLGPPDRSEVERRKTTEPAFGQEFELRQKMEDWLASSAQRESLKNQLEVLGTEFFSEKTAQPGMTATVVNAPKMQVAWRRYLLAAAAALALVAAAVWFFDRSQTTLYQQFAQHATPQLALRSEAETTAAEAEKFFMEKNYAAALTRLETLASNHPDALDVKMYRAICLIELDRSPEARPLLQPIAEGTSIWRSEARWYIALSHLRENDRENCRTELQKIQAGEGRFEEARRLGEKL